MKSILQMNTGTSRRTIALLLVLASALYVVYLLTYSGVIRTGDELWLMDASGNVAVKGEFTLSRSLYAAYTNSQIPPFEPMQSITAAPLFWLAYQFQSIGNFQSLFLFNPLVTTLIAVVLFLYARLLGYGEKVALIAAALFGITTIAWPYTQTFFREPLTSLTLILAAFGLEKARRAISQHGLRRGGGWLLFGLAATILAVLTKEAALILLPVLILMVIPGEVLSNRRSQVIFLIALVTGFVLLIAVSLIAQNSSSEFYRRFRVLDKVIGVLNEIATGWDKTPVYMLAMLISPGKGLIWFCPVLVLGLASPALLPKDRWREGWMWLFAVLWFALIYARYKGDIWFGGLAWGPRFLVPLVPLLMIPALPAIEKLLRKGWPTGWLSLILVGLLGFIIQIGSVYESWGDYYGYLQAQTRQLPWADSIIWSFRWSQPFGSLLHIPQAATTILWLIQPVMWDVVIIGVGILTALCALLWVLHLRHDTVPRWMLVSGYTAPVVLMVFTVYILLRAFPDARYKVNNVRLEELQAHLQSETSPDDRVVLSNGSYAAFFMNHFKGPADLYGLPESPGERPSPEQPPRLTSQKPDDLLTRHFQTVWEDIQVGGRYYKGGLVWLVSDTSQYLPWAVRPYEWYLAKYGYPVGTTEFDSRTRVTTFLGFPAPLPDQKAANSVGALFGDSIRLEGYDLSTPEQANARSFNSGDQVGLSLRWHAVVMPESDYTFAVHFVNSQGVVVLQQDIQPLLGNAPTSKWALDQPIRTNLGFVLPADLPPGDYQVWVTLYEWPSLEHLPVTSGTEVADHLVLATISVR
jgi:hypothetical protein